MKSHSDIQNSPDVATLFAAIEKINHRLDRLEGKPSEIKPSHPSRDQPSIAEAIADSVFSSGLKERPASLNPASLAITARCVIRADFELLRGFSKRICITDARSVSCSWISLKIRFFLKAK